MGTHSANLDDIVRTSVDAMLRRQLPAGSFPASPDFSQYGYCWLRDGAFVAYALDQAGEHQAAARFHDWCTAAVSGVGDVIDNALAWKAAGKPLDPELMPPARFALDGEAVVDDWPNFQVDGYGTWLWALGQHLRAQSRDELPERWRPAVEQTARYLDAFAFEPCFDVWEESGDSAVHTSTLACVAAGLDAAAWLLDDSSSSERAAEVREHLGRAGLEHRWFPKSTARGDVDSSTLWLSAPLGIFPAHDESMEATVSEIERTLTFKGGLRRFFDDNYFGGGAWPVLTCSLGLHYVRTGRLEDARRCLAWTLDRVSADGRLGEQYFGELRDPKSHAEWVERWGPPASELVWSHAMLALLALELSDAGGASEPARPGASGTDVH